MQRSKVTMADVAELAGVSRTSVSFVLNKVENANISDATRRRILDAVDELGYRPNAAARALAAQRSDWIGFITEIVTAPFAVNVIKGAQDAAWRERRFLLIAATDDAHAAGASTDDLQLQSAAIEKLLEQRVEGLIYAATWHRAVTVPELVHEVPTVLVNCVAANADLPAIVPDEVGGGRRATERLLRAGHRRIGLVNLDPAIPAGIGRLRGYREALLDAGVQPDDDLLVLGDATATGGFAATEQLLDLREPPTAIFCANDRMAMGAYDAIKERGLRIPTDIAVVGFDNQELIAGYLRPSLTTVALPFEEMGSLGVRTLSALNQGRSVSPVQTVDCPLLERSSV